MKRINLRLPIPVYAQLVDQSDKQNRAVAEVAREMILHGIEHTNLLAELKSIHQKLDTVSSKIEKNNSKSSPHPPLETWGKAMVDRYSILRPTSQNEIEEVRLMLRRV